MFEVALSASPIAWANDDIRGWGLPVDADGLLSDMADAGFSGTEMSHVYPADPKALKEVLGRHRIALTGAWRWCNLAHPERHTAEVEATKRHIDFCAHMGAFANLAEGYGSLHWDADGPRTCIRPLDDAAWNRLTRNLDELGAYARQQGTQLTVHPHGGTAVEKAAEIDRLFAGTNPELVGCCLDSGHSAYAGDDPVAVARKLGKRIRYVHLKDTRPDVLRRFFKEKPTFLEVIQWNIFGTPGSGSVDFAGFLEVLRDVGYRGWLVVEAEQDPALYPPFEVSRSAVAHVTHLVERLGGRVVAGFQEARA
ncbi:MAG: TIM barrel protein [Candidatus Xenobia bacterium]